MKEFIMTVLSHFRSVLSPLISVGLLIAMGTFTAPMGAAAATTKSASSPYYGRWTVDEERPAFTARGRVYKTIDVAPCGTDFCGVSVDDKGKCGPALFRFLGKHAMTTDRLQGHGKWGSAKKNIVIFSYPESETNVHGFELYLGDGYDFGDRSDNMPKFHASYKKLGKAKCSTR
jgi:hypothetical protein